MINQVSYPKKKFIHNIILLTLSLIIIYTSGYAMTTLENSLGAYVLIMPTIVMVCILLSKQPLLYKIDLLTLSYLSLMIMLTISFIINLDLDYVTSNIRMMLIITFAFCLVKLVSFDNFIKYFIKYIKYIIVIAIVVSVWINYLNMPLDLPVVYNINGAAYYNGIAFFVLVYSPLRTTGVFWEPGLFASFIIISMIFEITLKKEKMSYLNLFIMLIGLLSTQSTAGYMFLPFIVILLVSKNAKSYNTLILSLIFLISILLVIINLDDMIVYLSQINPYVFEKILNETGSYVERLESPTTNLKIFLSNPVFGAGIGKLDIIYREIAQLPQTSTSTYYLAAFGMFGLLYTWFWLYGIWKLKNQSVLSRITIITVFFLILNKEPHTSIVTTYCIMFYFLKEAYKVRSLYGSK